MIRTQTDILISGGGVAGLTAASAFGSAGFSVLCVEPTAPVTEPTAEGADLRTTALLIPSVSVLQAAGLWDRLAPHATALQVMRIIDLGSGDEPRQIKDFDAADLSDQPFGYNLPNWLLRRAMLARLAELPKVSFRPGVATTALLTREACALVSLSDASQIEAKLVIAADGRHSTMRAAAGIGVKTWAYGQKALTFAVTHQVPHGNVSTEIHRSGGPFTLVPLPDLNGVPASAVVWIDQSAATQARASLPEAAFEAEITARSAHILGPLRLASPRLIWPIISQLANAMAGERLALMAEAAHVMPPIGAQGLNTSLADLQCLLTLAREMPLGSAKMLQTYQRRRHPEVTARVLGIDALNRASMAQSPVLRGLRAMGLNGLHRFAPLRRSLMRAGLGLR